MNTTEKGTNFEKKVLAIVQQLIASNQFCVSGNYWEVFHQKSYYGNLRKSEIIVDISVEFRRTPTADPSLIVFIECKDYISSVPVNDVEEFYAKVNQMTGLNVKAMLFVRSALQAAAFDTAASLGMAVVRILEEDELCWLIERTNKDLTTGIANSIALNVMNALVNEHYVSIKQDTFARYKETATYHLEDIFQAMAAEQEAQ